MKRLFLAIIFVFLFFLTPLVRASSEQAYKDYLYQFDVYRQNYQTFQVAKNEYEKFKTLTSQTTALEATKVMLSQRDILLRAYLFLLNEKINETTDLSNIERNLYQTLIKNEVVFLDDHSKLIESIGSIGDTMDVSDQLESHYNVLQASMRQTINAITFADLNKLAKEYNANVAQMRLLIDTNRGIFTSKKQATIDRWLLQITNIRSLYQQKMDSLISQSTQLKGSSIDDQDRLQIDILKGTGEAKQYLMEGASYLGEVVNTLKYQD